MKTSIFGLVLRFLMGLVLSLSGLAQAAPPPGYCDVQVCNKLERVTFSPWSMVQDSMGAVCMPALLAKADAVPGKVLNAFSRWYQGSFNPTKNSVTRVRSVGACTPEPAVAPAPASAAGPASATRVPAAPGASPTVPAGASGSPAK